MQAELEKTLSYLGLLGKAKEIYRELGEKAALSYLRSSHRLLSKVYHPDLNPDNRGWAVMMQEKLNRLSELITALEDKELVDVLFKGRVNKKEDKKKILVVEDEFGLQEVFRDILLMEGYDVQLAVDGIDGLQIYADFRPDLVFTDVVMPRMTGIELVKKIRETDPEIKVIYVSGFFGIKGLKHDLDEDIIKYHYRTLAKPFRVSHMLELVKDYLDEPP